MPLEIERKFLIVNDDWQALVQGTRQIRQAYLTKNKRLSIRVRIEDDETATLTIKTAEAGIARREYEYPVPLIEAQELMERRESSIITKVRHIVPIADLTWEIDVFSGENEGLIVAEVEFDRIDRNIDLPPWIGTEVTHDRRYYNADLSKRPFQSW